MGKEPATEFGTFAKKARLKKGLGLNQAAKKMGISGAYLSRVETGTDNPSGQLIHKMSIEYGVPIEQLVSHAPGQRASTTAHAHAMGSIPDLRALYRLVGQDSERIENLVREILLERGTPEEDIERELAKLRSEFPRVRGNGRDDLFATVSKPRFLSRERIHRMAEDILSKHGLNSENYTPPTPIENVVENESGLLYRIDALECDKAGNPLVLGLTGWGEAGDRQIIINEALAASRRPSDESRFNFTLAHEFFHAIEHLPRVPKEAAPALARLPIFVESVPKTRASAAERAVDRWKNGTKARLLHTHEDWREWQANQFAASILMPRWAVRAEFVSRVKSESIAVEPRMLRPSALQLADQRLFGSEFYERSLAEMFAVSHQAMAVRLLELNLVTEGCG